MALRVSLFERALIFLAVIVFGFAMIGCSFGG
jgi:hypothetical protein